MTASRPPRKALVLATDGYEDLDGWYPILRFREMGARVVVASLARGAARGRQGLPLPVDVTLYEAAREEWTHLIVPGGLGADRLRSIRAVQDLLRRHDQAGRPIATSGHGVWVLVSAGLLRGRRATGPRSIEADLANAGAEIVDEPVCVDGNLVTARGAADVARLTAQLLAIPDGREAVAASVSPRIAAEA